MHVESLLRDLSPKAPAAEATPSASGDDDSASDDDDEK
jgi:hypothetical protein